MEGVKKIATISFVFSVFIFSDLYAQIRIIHDLEIKLSPQERSFHVVSLERDGLVLFRKQTTEFSEEFINWEIFYYDTELNLLARNYIETEFMYSIIGHTYENGILYLLFSGVKNLKKRLFIHRIEGEGQISEKIEIDSFFPDVLTYFSVFNKSIIIGGRERSKPSIVFYDQAEGRTIILQGLYERNMNVYDVNIDKANGIFTVIIGYRNKSRQASLNIRSYDQFGTPLENIRMEPRAGLDFIYGKGMIANNNLRVVSGIYSEFKSVEAAGIFLAYQKLNGESKTVYYPMNEILTELDSLQREQKYHRMDFKSNMSQPRLPHWYITEMKEYKNENFLITESFTIDKHGSTLTAGEKLIYYNNAVILGFNDDLSLTWMNTFDISTLCSSEVQKKVKVDSYADNLKLYYFNKTNLVEKLIQESKNLNPRFLEPLLPDQISHNDFYDCTNQPYHLKRWYEDNYFLAGTKPDPEGNDQDIFFIYKIQYQ